VTDLRALSLWHDSLPPDDTLAPRPALDGDTDADVAIVGAGYTGLWTAYYLLGLDPSLRVVVLEAEVAGFGASGRNGGWCSALLPMRLPTMVGGAGQDGALAMQRAMFDTVDEVGRAAAAEGIDCHYAKGGYLHLATNPAHTVRLRDELAEARRFGLGEDDLRWLDRAEAAERLDAAGVLGALYTPHCAAIHPARLARGLAEVVERRGGTIYEGTRATAIEAGRVATDRGAVRAEIVVRATEGFTSSLDGEQRTLVPLYSLMIATEPLPDEVWDRIGWSDAETLTDGRRLIIYAQRTADGRIAFGGRGAPYRFGSRPGGGAERSPRVWAALEATTRALLPGVGDAAVTHRWGGALGVPRDWYSSVGIDRTSGLAWGGGYVGDGVTTSYLAGRTLADLILERTTALTQLPWVGHRSPPWEPEPLRWLGINAGLRLTASADRHEARTGRPSAWRERALRTLLG
jgi:glycine/D-amino acid oxidase-like deaminating enzyme